MSARSWILPSYLTGSAPATWSTVLLSIEFQSSVPKHAHDLAPVASCTNKMLPRKLEHHVILAIDAARSWPHPFLAHTPPHTRNAGLPHILNSSSPLSSPSLSPPSHPTACNTQLPYQPPLLPPSTPFPALLPPSAPASPSSTPIPSLPPNNPQLPLPLSRSPERQPLRHGPPRFGRPSREKTRPETCLTAHSFLNYTLLTKDSISLASQTSAIHLPQNISPTSPCGTMDSACARQGTE